jgi:uncharacterized phage protein gp47/JayE
VTGTLVPPPQFGPLGFVAPPENSEAGTADLTTVLGGRFGDINSAFGGQLDGDLETPQGQLASSDSAIIGMAHALFCYFANQVDPSYSEGRMQDAVGRIYFVTRKPAQPTVVAVQCLGRDTVIIPAGALVQDSAGNLYAAQQPGTIAGGTVTVSFACTVAGPISCPAGSIQTVPYTTINGWDRAANAADGITGTLVEGRADFEFRRANSVAINAAGYNDALQAAAMAVPGVIDAAVYDNPTASLSNTGSPVVHIPAYSVYCVVAGGTDQDVAAALLARKPPGVPWAGNTTVTIPDTQQGFNPPYPLYTVTFQRPAALTIWFGISIIVGPNTPSNYIDQITAAILLAFNGGAEGGRPRIGQAVYAARFYPAIYALGPWADGLVSIIVGSNFATAVITASMFNLKMTVTAASGATIVPGMLVHGPGMRPSYVVSNGTGTGGVGDYNMSQSQIVASAVWEGITQMGTGAPCGIDHIPVCSADSIVVNA